MPIYEFVNEDKELVEAFYPMADAPSIGSIVRIDGKRAVRIVRPSRMHVNGSAFKEFESYTINPRHPAIKKRGRFGRAVFGSQRELDRFCERSEKLSETINPDIPTYEHGAAGDIERCDKDDANSELMKQSKQARQTGDALRGMGAIDIDTLLEGE